MMRIPLRIPEPEPRETGGAFGLRCRRSALPALFVASPAIGSSKAASRFACRCSLKYHFELSKADRRSALRN